MVSFVRHALDYRIGFIQFLVVSTDTRTSTFLSDITKNNPIGINSLKDFYLLVIRNRITKFTLFMILIEWYAIVIYVIQKSSTQYLNKLIV
jgi:hypothetical protein